MTGGSIQVKTLRMMHTLPGRLRMGLRPAVIHPECLVNAVVEHEGIGEAVYTPCTRSILVTYDPAVVDQNEVVMRTALALAIDGEVGPVRIVTGGSQSTPSFGAFLAAVLGIAAVITRTMSKRGHEPCRLEKLCGGATALSVLHHGVQEVRVRGNFDPEVLSLVYLVASFTRGEYLWPSLVTWAATFGRHLTEVPRTGVKLSPVELSDDHEGEYEFVVSHDDSAPVSRRATRLVQGVLLSLVTGGGGQGLLDDLRQISRAHGEVLEGMEGLPGGVPLRFR